MTVYLAHELESPKLRDSIAPATKFGEIRCANRFYIHGDELEQDGPDNVIPAGYRVNMERVAASFNPAVDFLLIVGDHLQVLALACILVTRYGYVSVLRWDRQLGEYIPVRLGSWMDSGLVPPPQPVLVSGTHIGDRNAEETRRNAQAVATESPTHAYRHGYDLDGHRLKSTRDDS